MMKKAVIASVLSIFIFSISYSQVTSAETKSRLMLNLGMEYRITPIYAFNTLTEQAAFTNIDKQNAGPALNLEMEYFITNNLSISLSNLLRYDLVISNRPQSIERTSVASSDYKLIFDYNLNIAYYFKMFEKGRFYVSAGFAIMSRNTDFSFEENFTDNDGNDIGSLFTIADFYYNSNVLSLGYEFDDLKFYVKGYMSNNSPYFVETTSFIVPSFGITYSLIN